MSAPARVPEGFVVLARLGSAHGLRGEVKLEVRTDDPDRLAVGARVITDDPLVGELTIARRRTSGGAALIAFEQVTDRADAEALTGLLLVGPRIQESDAWYPEDLVGLAALAPDGRALGEIVAVLDSPAHHLLDLREPSGARTLVPFVSAIVPDVDLAAGTLVIDAPGGLLADLDDGDDAGETDDDADSASQPGE